MPRIEPDNSLRFEEAPAPSISSDNNLEASPADEISHPGTGVLEKTYAQDLGRILKVMKMSGIIYGETNLVDFPSSSRRSHTFGWLYPCLMNSALWISILMNLVNLGYAISISHSLKDIFILVPPCTWSFLCAGNATISVFGLPIGRRKASKFERFLNLMASTITAKQNKSQNMRRKKVFWFMVFYLPLNVVVNFVLLNFVAADSRFGSWSQSWSSIIRLFYSIFIACSAYVSTFFPIYLFCTVCSILSEEYGELEKDLEGFVKSGSFQVKTFRKSHEKLLTVVEFADKTFSLLVLLNLACYIPQVVFLLHQMATLPSPVEDHLAVLVMFAYFSINGLAVLALLLYYASGVNEKIHGFSRMLQRSSLPLTDTSESCELLRFLLHLQGEPLGLTVGGLVVITKSFSFTVFGALISYFTVLVSLPQTSS